MAARRAILTIAVAALLADLTSAEAAPVGQPSPSDRAARSTADFGLPSRSTAELIDWVIRSGDNGDRPFIIIDKITADLYVFLPSGQSYLQTPVLLGIAKGDVSAPGVGDRELSKIPVSQRTTPSGRFSAYFGRAIGYKEKVLWVDYPSALSLHPVVTSNPAEHRLARLRSPTPKDNRITFGCINVDAGFYHEIIAPLFRNGGIVYIMPETQSLSAAFPRWETDEP